MGEMNLDGAIESDLSNELESFEVDTDDTESTSDQKITWWRNDEWTAYYGYFTKIPEINAAVNAKATWTIGKGFKADETTTMLLDTIKGWGKDTFNTILENMIRTYYVGGDGFCEIVRDDETNLINLKPLNPGQVSIGTNRLGIIVKYKVSKPDAKDGDEEEFEPEEIFHLARNRVADQIHGTSVITSIENIILARNEAITDYKDMMHKYMKPRYIFHLDSDDETKIATFKAKMDAVWTKGENIYIPKDTVVPELQAVAPNSTLDPKTWIEQQGDYFYEAVGTPQIILGGAGEFTEATAKIVYLAWQQNVEEEQLFIEEEILQQLNLVIELEFPASLENELLSDKAKDGGQQTQPNETTAGSGQ